MRWPPRRRISRSWPALAVAARDAHRRDRRRDRPDRRRRQPCRRARPKAAGACPQLVDQPCLELDGGRHPVVEAALRAGRRALRRQRLSRSAPSDRLWLITGPNMGGKSTFLRQVALIAAARPGRQLSSPPRAPRSASSTACSAASARPTISRAAARPSWSRWSRPPRSSRRRRRSSLVILDEIGRGTSTYDGLAIAWAVVEAMHDAGPLPHPVRDPLSRADAARRPARRAVAPPCPRARMEGRPGPAPRSRRRRRPTAATASPWPSSPACRPRCWRAPRRCSPSSRRAATQPAGSPPGSTICRCSPAPPRPSRRDPLAEALAAIDPDALTPREALEALYALKRAVADQHGSSTRVIHAATRLLIATIRPAPAAVIAGLRPASLRASHGQ